MEPDFVQGDIIIVDPSISPSPGDFVVASRVDPLCGGLEVTFKNIARVATTLAAKWSLSCLP